MKEKNFFKIMAIVIAIIWIVAPDVIPGPIDDILLMLWTASEVKKHRELPER